MKKSAGQPGPFVTAIELDRGRVPSFDEFPFDLPLIRDFQRLKLHPSVTFIVGPNGSGKSTLMEAVAGAYGFNMEGGGKNFNFRTRDSHSKLDDYIRLPRTLSRPLDGYFLRAETFYNLASEIDNIAAEDVRMLWSYGGKSLHQRSHGESFLDLICHRLFGGFYILDEPEAALSPDGVLTLIARMHQLVEMGSQFIIATHSPLLITYPKADLYEIEDGVLVKKPYSETRHFLLSRDLLNRPEVIHREIMRSTLLADPSEKDKRN